MSKEMVLTKKEKMETLKNVLIQNQDDLRRALPQHIGLERLERLYLNAVMRNPKLLECTMQSLVKSAMDAAQTGLEPDGIHAHLIPYKDNKKGVVEAQYQIDYKGLIKLARQSGEISNLKAVCVYENDKFEIHEGTRDEIVHVRAITDRGKKIGVYSIAKFTDGTVDFLFLTPEDIAKIRKASKASSRGPWVDWEDEMWKKSAIRRHSKILPQAQELQIAAHRDEEINFGLHDMPSALENKTGKKTSELAEKLTGESEEAEFEEVDKKTEEAGKEPESASEGEGGYSA